MNLRVLLHRFFQIVPENNQLERIWVLAKTDYILRYYGTSFGIVWAFINPLFRVLIYYFVFTMVFQMDIPNYALYLFSGILLWQFFRESTNKGITLLKSKRYLIESININKPDLFISSLLSNLMGLLINFLIYFLISLIFGVHYNVNVLWFPVIILNTCLLILGTNLILASVSVHFKDIQHFWDMAMLLGMWITPIFYGKSIIFEKVPALLYLNPMAGIIINLRETLLYGNPPDMRMIGYDYLYALVLIGLAYPIFKKVTLLAAEKI
jgi:ABC-type polysaccharide/polyol phosphate export permease